MSSIRQQVIEMMQAHGDQLIDHPNQFRFRFTCPESCWGTCCGVEPLGEPWMVALTPYDVYRMAQGLKKTMRGVLEDHCIYVPDDQHGAWPFFFLKEPARQNPCEFLQEDRRCGIREFRPEACRSVPIYRTALPDDQFRATRALWFGYPHPNCQGKEADAPEWTAAEWLSSNDVNFEKADDFLVLRFWANTLDYPRWGIPKIAEVLGTFLYCPDEFVPVQTKTDEMFTRSIAAAKLLLTLFRDEVRLHPDGAPNANRIVSRTERFMKYGVDVPTPGRNDPCECRSGKKYKQCCGR